MYILCPDFELLVGYSYQHHYNYYNYNTFRVHGFPIPCYYHLHTSVGSNVFSSVCLSVCLAVHGESSFDHFRPVQTCLLGDPTACSPITWGSSALTLPPGPIQTCSLGNSPGLEYLAHMGPPSPTPAISDLS